MTSEGRVAREGVPTAVTSGKRSKKQQQSENSLAVQWLGHGAFTAEGAGSIPGQGTKIPQTLGLSGEKHSRQKEQQVQVSWDGHLPGTGEEKREEMVGNEAGKGLGDLGPVL